MKTSSSSVYVGISTDSILCRSWAGTHSRCEFLSATATSSPEHSIRNIPRHPLAHYFLFPLVLGARIPPCNSGWPETCYVDQAEAGALETQLLSEELLIVDSQWGKENHYSLRLQ